MAGSKLLSYWPEMSAAIMFCWPLIASRVAFSCVKRKKFHFSVSWCLWSMIVMGNDSAFISNHFLVQAKWIVNLKAFYALIVYFVEAHCIYSFRISYTASSYSQQTLVVSTSNSFPYPHVYAHRAGLWHNTDITHSAIRLFIFPHSYAKNVNLERWHFWQQ